jgi:hypothetical protein
LGLAAIGGYEELPADLMHLSTGGIQYAYQWNPNLARKKDKFSSTLDRIDVIS